MSKIKLIHLLLDPEYHVGIENQNWLEYLKKQNESISRFTQISSRFYKYVQIFNKIYNEQPPFDTCNDPDSYVSHPSLIPKDGRPWLSSYHYGAFKAHQEAILNEFSDDVDVIVIVEGDVVPTQNFTKTVYDSVEFGSSNNASFITLSNVLFGEGSDAAHTTIDYGDWQKIDHFLCCNCYMIFKSEKNQIQEKLSNAKWMEFDIWLYWNYDKRVPIFKTKNPVAYETTGFSIIDQRLKESNYLP